MFVTGAPAPVADSAEAVAGGTPSLVDEPDDPCCCPGILSTLAPAAEGSLLFSLTAVPGLEELLDDSVGMFMLVCDFLLLKALTSDDRPVDVDKPRVRGFFLMLPLSLLALSLGDSRERAGGVLAGRGGTGLPAMDLRGRRLGRESELAEVILLSFSGLPALVESA